MKAVKHVLFVINLIKLIFGIVSMPNLIQRKKGIYLKTTFTKQFVHPVKLKLILYMIFYTMTWKENI